MRFSRFLTNGKYKLWGFFKWKTHMEVEEMMRIYMRKKPEKDVTGS